MNNAERVCTAPSLSDPDFVLGDVGAIMVGKGAHRMAGPSVGGARAIVSRRSNGRGIAPMAAMKPRTGDGPLEVTKEGRGIVLRMPIEGGGRLVVEMTPDEAAALGEAIRGCPGVG